MAFSGFLCQWIILLACIIHQPLAISNGLFQPLAQVPGIWPSIPTVWIWFTEHYSNKIGRFNPVDHTFMEISTPSQNSLPYGIIIDSSGNVWFTENNSSVAMIAEYTTLGNLLEYKIRNSFVSSLTPHLITVDPEWEYLVDRRVCRGDWRVEHRSGQPRHKQWSYRIYLSEDRKLWR